MRKRLIIALVLLFGVAFLRPAFALDKIGYVDLGKLFDEYQKTKDFDKDLEKKATGYEKERDAKISELKQLQDKLNLLSDKEKEKKQKELDEKRTSAQDFILAKKDELLKERDDRAKDIIKDIEAAVSQCAQRDGYTMVLNDRALIYNNKANDLTSKALEILQTNYKKGSSGK